MRKRDFLASGAAVAALSTLPMRAAQGAELKVGKDYRKISPAQRTQAPDGKIEVVKFFWVACPHCRSIEPVIQDWLKRQPADVFFRRVHVNFRTPSHQQLYYTLAAMGEEERLINDVFAEIQDKKNRLNKANLVFDWAQAQGLDREAFIKAYKSFGVKTNMRKASQETSAFGVTGVPSLAVNGKFITAPSMVGSNGQAMKVVDQLIDMERKGG